MDYQEALKKLDGESVGGQLIARDENGVAHIVGHYHEGLLHPASTDAAAKLLAGIEPKRKPKESAEAEGRRARGKHKDDPEPDVVAEPEDVVVDDQIKLDFQPDDDK